MLYLKSNNILPFLWRKTQKTFCKEFTRVSKTNYFSILCWFWA